MMKQRFFGRLPVIASLTLCSAIANAVPVTYDFTGTGFLYTFTGAGATTVESAETITGWVTIDVLAPAPSGADSYIWSNYVYDYNGWVESDFFIDWGSGDFNPAAVPGQTSSDMFAQVNNGVEDRLYNREHYAGSVGLTSYISDATLIRQSYDPTWLSDFSFDQSVGLGAAFNVLTFANYSRTPAAASVDYLGFEGLFTLTSFARRTASVPEPGALALFGFGLAALGMARRQRHR